MKLGKRFIFACIAIFCASVVSILEHYTGEIYLKIVVVLAGIFTIGQSITDYKNGNNKEIKNELR